MPRPRKLLKCQFLPFFQVRTSSPPLGTLWVDVSSDADLPINQLLDAIDNVTGTPFVRAPTGVLAEIQTGTASNSPHITVREGQ